MSEVIPAILESDFGKIEEKIHLVESLVSWVQIDIADNTLVPNTTFLDPEPFRDLVGDATGGPPAKTQLPSRVFDGGKERQDPLKYELHMMVSDPLRYLENFAKAGFKRFYAHVEGQFVEEYIERCYALGVEVGLAIDGPTDLEKLRHYLDDIDCVLVMAIEAGFSGRPYREDTVEKIKKIRELDFEIPIAVDGAMNDVNAAKVVAVGATRINSNSYIFRSSDIKLAIEKLKNIK